MTPKQERFVQEYLKDLNATQAAIRAGYSSATARSIGAENLTKPDIAEALRAAQSQVAAQAGIDAAWVLKEQQALYQLTKSTEPETARKALRDIGEHLGMYVERVETTGRQTLYVIEGPPRYENGAEWQSKYSQIQ